jgi:hypothetical protein
LVAALALGWFVTARVGRTDALAETGTVASFAPPTTTVATFPDRLRRILPAGAQCGDQDRSRAATRCSVEGIAVDYVVFGIAEVGAAYRAAIGAGSSEPRPTTTFPACARGGEEERPWSRPGAPNRTVGRYACRVERGRAAMWWTVDDRGVLAHATATDGDLASLFAWWELHSER